VSFHIEHSLIRNISTRLRRDTSLQAPQLELEEGNENMLLPKHIGFIPDGNRRWAAYRGLNKENGYAYGIAPGLTLYEQCKRYGIEEVSVYGFTQDNVKRPSEQTHAFRQSCVEFALEIHQRGAALLVVGDDESDQFPPELRRFRQRQGDGIKTNFLVNYGWKWDLYGLKQNDIKSSDVSRLDLIVRWGGGRRLSGFLPVQSVYADIFVVNDYWPDFKPEHLDAALEWFSHQDRTLGG
jgi:undecaprenyl diphosphate synthase